MSQNSISSRLLWHYTAKCDRSFRYVFHPSGTATFTPWGVCLPPRGLITSSSAVRRVSPLSQRASRPRGGLRSPSLRERSRRQRTAPVAPGASNPVAPTTPQTHTPTAGSGGAWLGARGYENDWNSQKLCVGEDLKVVDCFRRGSSEIQRKKVSLFWLFLFQRNSVNVMSLIVSYLLIS